MSMKAITTLLSLLSLTAAQLRCPTDLAYNQSLSRSLTMFFQVQLASSEDESSLLCLRFESGNTGWIAWGIHPAGQMAGAEAIIGLPANNTVKKYLLLGNSLDDIIEMPQERQTLTDASISQDGEGRTTMAFGKVLNEDKYGIYVGKFYINTFIYAEGSTNDLSYHGESRGRFGMDFGQTFAPTSLPSIAPSATQEIVTTSLPLSSTVSENTGNASLTTTTATSPNVSFITSLPTTPLPLMPTELAIVPTISPTVSSQNNSSSATLLLDSVPVADGASKEISLARRGTTGAMVTVVTTVAMVLGWRLA